MTGTSSPLPPLLIQRQVEKVLGPRLKPNARGRRLGVTWDWDDSLRPGAIVLQELVPAFLGDGAIWHLDHVAIPITSIDADYGIWDILYRNRRDFMGQSTAHLHQEAVNREEAEAQWHRDDTRQAMQEDVDAKDRGRRHFGSWSYRGGTQE